MRNNKKRVMYNENVKKAYIADSILISESQNIELLEQGIVNRFIRSEELENSMGKDIYEMNKAETKCFLTKFLCGGQLYQATTLYTLRAYVDWAIKNDYTMNRENPFSQIKITDIDVSDSYTDVMVKDERDLVESLDTVLDDIRNDTADTARWCIFLLIFAGISFKDLFYIKKEDVDLENRTIQYGSQTIHISDVLNKVLYQYLKMDELQKVGKGDVGYSKPIIDEGYLLSNTKKYGADRDKMRLSCTSDISLLMRGCAKKIKPSTIHDSGIFYRMFSKEQQTGEIDSLEYLRARKHQSSVISNPDRVKKMCWNEYQTWKRAFNL